MAGLVEGLAEAVHFGGKFGGGELLFRDAGLRFAQHENFSATDAGGNRNSAQNAFARMTRLWHGAEIAGRPAVGKNFFAKMNFPDNVHQGRLQSAPMAQPPLILVSASTEKKGVEFGDVSLSLSENYPRAVLLGGGLPVVLACAPERALVAESVRRCDGVLLTGGDDVNPGLYRRRLPARLRRTVGATDRLRDLRELLVIAETLRQRKPLLAICRGQQLLNVALGGTLLVDIAAQLPQAINHDRSDRKGAVVHEVQLTADSLLAKMLRSRKLGVNSSHHQAVDRVAPALRVTGQSTDGVVEVLEAGAGLSGWLPFLLAVQFHPERLAGAHPEHRKIFSSFISACNYRR
jgi:putative glutamine amidotransferase